MVLGGALTAAAQQPGCSTAATCANTPDWSSLCQTGSSVGKWQCWQKDLTSTGNYVNGYRDLRVSVTFTSPLYPAVSYHTVAFWNGKTSGGQDQLSFRMAFGPYPGTWNWSATCASSYGTTACGSDSGLNLSGTVTVTSSAPAGNPIYQKGLLKQVLSMTALGVMIFNPPSHSDSTPFLWHGDTAWAASTQACRNQWREYVDNRKANGFTVVHLALAPSWAGQLATGTSVGPLNKLNQAPFETLTQTCPSSSFDRESTYPNCKTRWKPDFWREIDGMIQYANQQGLVVYIPGLIQPYQEWPSTEAVKVFTRNFVARMRGYAVVLSPGFDSDPTACEPGGCARNKLALMDASGNEARTVDPTYPLLINHYATIPPAKIALVHPKGWLNANGYQSGFSDAKLLDLANRPRTWAQEIRYPASTTSTFANPRKPAINTESIYDFGYGTTDVTTLTASVNHYNRFRARQAGYSSWLAGATGYSFGAAGLWEWGVCSLSPLPSWAVTAATCQSAQNPVPQTGYTSFKAAMCNADPANAQRALGDWMRQINYSTLVANEQAVRIKNNGDQAAYHQMVAARDANRLMVYMPHNSKARVDLSNLPFAASFRAGLYNPRTGGNPVSVTCTFVSSNIWDCPNPTALTSSNVGLADWLLVIEPAQATGSRRLDLSVGIDEEGQRGLWGRIVTFDGSRAPEPFLIAAGESELPRGAQVAREAGGDFLVVWEGRDAYGGTSEIRAQWVSEEGVLLGDLFALSATRQAPDQTSPTVVFDSSNQGLVAWVERDAATAAASLVVRSVAVGGEAVGGLLCADDVTAEEPRAPRLACGATGACYIAWESVDTAAGSVSLRSRPLDTLRTGFLTAGVVLGQAEENLWLSTATVDGMGRLETSWEKLDSNQESLGWSAIAMDEAGELYTVSQ